MSFINKRTAWTDSQRRKWKEFFEEQKSLRSKIKEHGSDILESENFQSSQANIQHGNMTVHQHSINVTKLSLKLSRKLPFHFNERALVRGALLHDYFLYDWHDGSAPGNIHPKLHGFYHPGIALKNAVKDYNLSKREKDIIKKHMWPLTINPPRCREAWIVCIADKYASTLETLKLKKGIIAIDYAESL